MDLIDDPVSRRNFMKIMSASFALAGLGVTGCRRPEHKILPFSKMPENYVHGKLQYYATSMPTNGCAAGGEIYDGRPIKIEGNGEHPNSNGGTDQYAQASVLSLYDPDRGLNFKLAEEGQQVIAKPRCWSNSTVWPMTRRTLMGKQLAIACAPSGNLKAMSTFTSTSRWTQRPC